jgi:hypothetical protein
MRRNMQLLWIAEAEARQFEAYSQTERAASEPQLSVISAVRGAARGNRWRRLIAQLLAQAPAPGPASPAEPGDPSAAPAARGQPHPPMVVVETAFEDQRS